MSATLTDADLERARHDPDFRRKLLTDSFERMIARLEAATNEEQTSPEATQGARASILP
jgi:hypothetical protein